MVIKDCMLALKRVPSIVDTGIDAVPESVFLKVFPR